MQWRKDDGSIVQAQFAENVIARGAFVGCEKVLLEAFLPVFHTEILQPITFVILQFKRIVGLGNNNNCIVAGCQEVEIFDGRKFLFFA